MLQYTVHPPPLQVSFSKSTLKFRNNDHYPHRRTTNNNNNSTSSNNNNVNNSSSFRPSTAPAVPSSPSSPYHSPSTFFPAPPPPLPSRFILPADDDELPSPSFPPASLPKAISRLPSAAAQPPTTANDSYFPPSSSSPAIAPVAISSFGSSSSVSDNDDIPDVLVPGDVVGHGLPLRSETLRPAKLPVAAPLPSPHAPPADAEFEVVRKLGTGSYAVVYLVREVLSRPTPPSSDSGLDMDFDDDSAQGQRQQRRDEVEYGREYAVKLLSKANLDADALAAQLFEATVHQSLPAHPNLVSLHRSYETRSYLLLLLEFVPGEDLFYFLEQARDHYVPPSPSPPPSPSTADARTPPTPGLLSSLHPSQLLSPVRLRLVARMFAQMCEAVAVCHDAGVFHRDIKPENFIVTDGLGPVDERGVRERRVVVKLSDFGLATTDEESADMDCGSAPYMAYECRNNLAPTYRPRAADVWSLGIVLINMLYHCNPWTDTADGTCTSFTAYRANPTSFLSARFPGLTPAVTAFLSQRVFCILPDPGSCEPRVSARELGIWVRDLPLMLAGGSAAIARTISGGPGRGHVRGASASSFSGVAGVVGVGHALGSVPPSRRPSSRIMSRVPSTVAIAAVSVTTAVGGSTAGTAICEEICEEPREQVIQEQEDAEQEQDQDQDQDANNGRDSRTSTSTKRRKRGARKNKSAAASSTPVPVPSLNATATTMDTSEMLASASQTLARELSRASRGTGPSLRSVPSNPSIHTHVHSHAHAHASYGPSFVGAGMPAVSALPVPAKKPSIWKLGFGKSGDGQRQDKDKDSKDKDSKDKDKERETPGRAANVSDLILGLSADPSAHSAHSPHGSNQTTSAGSGSAKSGASGRSEDRAWARGRQPRDAPSSSPVHHHPHPHPHPHLPPVPISPVHHHPHPHPPPVPISVSISPPSSASVAPAATAFGSPFGSGARSAFGGGVGGTSRSSLAVNVVESNNTAAGKVPQRSPAGPPARSPARSTNRSPPRSGAWSPNGAGSSNASVNSSSTSPRSAGAGSASWRNSMASTSTASSAFTRYSNQSARSVATSVSSAASEGNWRAKSTVSVASGATNATGAKEKGKGRSGGGKAPQYPYPYSGGVPPPNVKYMTGVPWELSELPRQLHPKPEGDIFGQPPAPRPRRSKPKALSAAGVVDNNLGTISESGRVDAGTSTTDLSMVTGGEDASGNGEDGGQKKVVQKGQINALAKMLGALRR